MLPVGTARGNDGPNCRMSFGARRTEVTRRLVGRNLVERLRDWPLQLVQSNVRYQMTFIASASGQSEPIFT